LGNKAIWVVWWIKPNPNKNLSQVCKNAKVETLALPRHVYSTADNLDPAFSLKIWRRDSEALEAFRTKAITFNTQ